MHSTIGLQCVKVMDEKEGLANGGEELDKMGEAILWEKGNKRFAIHYFFKMYTHKMGFAIRYCSINIGVIYCKHEYWVMKSIHFMGMSSFEENGSKIQEILNLACFMF